MSEGGPMKGALQPTTYATWCHCDIQVIPREMLCKIIGSIHDYDFVLNDYYIYNFITN